MDIETTPAPSLLVDVDHSWRVPKSVDLNEQGWLIPSSSFGKARRYIAEGGLQLVRDFALLENATDVEIIERAQQWGLLRAWANKSWLPRPSYREGCPHVARLPATPMGKACDACRPETLAEWREMARLVRVLVDILGQRGEPYPLEYLRDLPTHDLHVRSQRDFYPDELTELRQRRKQEPTAKPKAAELRPKVDSHTDWVCGLDGDIHIRMLFGDNWDDSRAVTAFILGPWLAKTTSLWFDGKRCWLRVNCVAGELALQLSTLADGAERREVCSNCRDVFKPRKRRKRPGDASYCEKCRQSPNFAAAKRRISRERQRERRS